MGTQAPNPAVSFEKDTTSVPWGPGESQGRTEEEPPKERDPPSGTGEWQGVPEPEPRRRGL